MDLPSWIQAIATTVALAITSGALIREQVRASRREAAHLEAAVTAVRNAYWVAMRVQGLHQMWSKPDDLSKYLLMIDGIRGSLDRIDLREIDSDRAVRLITSAQEAISDLSASLEQTATAALDCSMAVRVLKRSYNGLHMVASGSTLRRQRTAKWRKRKRALFLRTRKARRARPKAAVRPS